MNTRELKRSVVSLFLLLVCINSKMLQFLSQPEELEVKERILIAILCKTGVSKFHIVSTKMLGYNQSFDKS
uniref:Uncharacterized protein n=1 Tax=Arundo donax TaxID=35708 RepID=A0A0A9GIH4_ARUDO